MYTRRMTSSGGRIDMSNEQIVQIVYKTIDEYNKLLPKENHLIKDLKFPVVQANSFMDSISIINLLVMIEEEFKHSGYTVVLLDEENFQQDSNPLASLGSIVALITKQVQRWQHSIKL